MRPTATARRAARFAYGCYAWTALLLITLPLAALLAVTPGLERRRRAARRGARLFLGAIGSPLRVGGEPPPGTCVVVANHSSYLDGLIMTAALPPRFTFLIKHEMAIVPLAGFILKRLGSKFVDRADARHRTHTARDLVASAINGDALALFPEGTFDGEPGLKPFQTGAFGAAWRASLPVVPAVVLGARDKLPSGALLPAPGPLEVRVCRPLAAADYRSARELMRAAREAMLEHLGEPDRAERDADAVSATDAASATRFSPSRAGDGGEDTVGAHIAE